MDRNYTGTCTVSCISFYRVVKVTRKFVVYLERLKVIYRSSYFEKNKILLRFGNIFYLSISFTTNCRQTRRCKMKVKNCNNRFLAKPVHANLNTCQLGGKNMVVTRTMLKLQGNRLVTLGTITLARQLRFTRVI